MINTAGSKRVDEAERRPHDCFRENTVGSIVLETICAGNSTRLLTFSRALVFDGQRETPYRERDRTGPRNIFGRNKALAEREVLHLYPAALVVRAGVCFGPWDNQNFVSSTLSTLRDGHVFEAADDLMISPTYIPDHSHTILIC